MYFIHKIVENIISYITLNLYCFLHTNSARCSPLHKHRLKSSAQIGRQASGFFSKCPFQFGYISLAGSSVTFAIQVAASRISEALFPSHFPGIVEQIGLPGKTATPLSYVTDVARSRCLFEKVILRC